MQFIRELGALVAAPAETNVFRTTMLRDALFTPSPVYIEDEGAGKGLCCVRAKKGVLGRCLKCGGAYALFVHCPGPSRMATTLPEVCQGVW